MPQHLSVSRTLVNQNGGIYKPGPVYDVRTEAVTAAAYRRLQKENPGALVVAGKLAKETGVSRNTATKIMKEVDETGTIEDPTVAEALLYEERKTGVGLRSLDERDELLLLPSTDSSTEPLSKDVFLAGKVIVK